MHVNTALFGFEPRRPRHFSNPESVGARVAERVRALSAVIPNQLFPFLPRLQEVNRIVLPLVLCALATGVARAADSDPAPPGCIGSAPLGKFRVSVSRAGNSAVLPISDVSSIPPGAHLIWDPVHLSHRISHDGEVAALIVPAKRGGDLVVLPARKAGQGAVWDLPQGAEVVALVIGPDGLSMGKVKSLVARNEDLLSQLASYAQQTSQVESLVQTLADSEQTGGGADAALRGFSSRWGVSVPKLDAKAPPDQQASTLLSAILPSATTYDPLAPSGAQMQQTTGLAASIAGLFFGNTVGLAAGGAALVTNLKSSLFPNTEFRSAYAQSAGAGVMAFCAKNAAAKSRTRTAYLWAYRVPGLALPSVALAGPSFLPTAHEIDSRRETGGGFEYEGTGACPRVAAGPGRRGRGIARQRGPWKRAGYVDSGPIQIERRAGRLSAHGQLGLGEGDARDAASAPLQRLRPRADHSSFARPTRAGQRRRNGKADGRGLRICGQGRVAESDCPAGQAHRHCVRTSCWPPRRSARDDERGYRYQFTRRVPAAAFAIRWCRPQYSRNRSTAESQALEFAGARQSR